MKPLWLVLLVAMVAGQQARDAAPAQARTGTAVLTGTVVVDEAANTPLRRALVGLTMSSEPTKQRQVATDDNGRFAFTGLPSGNARLLASKPAYVTTYYGAKRPGSTQGIPVAVTEGQTTSVTLRVPRGGVISGTVFDENGRPLPGVGVRVEQAVTSATGQRSFVSYANSALIPATDDRGAYRIFGLPPGDFIVSAQPRVSGTGEIREPTAAELQWAERQVQGTGSGAPAPGTSTAAPARGRTVTYALVYHPGVVSIAAASVVSVATGQERAGIDLKMQFVPTARIEGRVSTPDGQPARAVQITLIPKSDGTNTLAVERAITLIGVGLMNGLGGQSAADGTFSVQSVEPGEYTLMARTGGIGRGVPPAERLWARTDIAVNGQDVTGLSLQLAQGLTMSGTFRFEGRTPAPAATRVSVTLRPADSTGVAAALLLTPQPQGSDFLIDGIIPAPYRLVATQAGWTLKSALVGGRDIADLPLVVKPGENVSDVVVTFTDSSAEVTGILYDGANRPSADLTIVLFSADRSKWFSGSRHVRPAARPATDGRFTFQGLMPGEYYLAALTDVAASDLASPAFLDQVAPAAIKVAVVAGEKKTQDIKIAR